MSPINRELLEKYIRGACTAAEEEEVLHWLDMNDSDDYPKALHATGKYKHKENEGWRLLRIHFDELKPVALKDRLFIRKWKWAVAVTIVALVGISFYFYQNDHWVRYQNKYQTSYGEVKRVTLKDGTSVTLNAASVLSVRKGFDEKNRVVYLEGEAFFEVEKHTNLPFIVKTGRVDVTALGTSFDVSNFKNASQISVALKEGKVAVNANDRAIKKRIVLKAGEEAVYDKAYPGELKIESKFDPKERLAWQRQVIYFKNAGMQEVINKLERFYGVDISTQGLKDKHWRLSGEYKGETLKNILESLSFNYGIGFEIEGEKVVLYKK